MLNWIFAQKTTKVIKVKKALVLSKLRLNRPLFRGNNAQLFLGQKTFFSFLIASRGKYFHFFFPTWIHVFLR